MIHINEYAAKMNVTRRWVEIQIQRGLLQALKQDNKLYIVSLPDDTSTPDTFNLEALKKMWDSEIEKCINLNDLLATASPADAKDIRAKIITTQNKIQQQVENAELRLNIKLKGYSYKSIRRKITSKKVSRSTRSDKHTVRNRILKNQDNQARLLNIAKYVYFQNATSNFSLLTDLIIEFSKRNEDCYEFAAVPRSTLYKFLYNKFSQSGSQHIHQFLNHNNLFHSAMPKVPGAFTLDTNFMQYILGDDNLRDTYSVLVWDEGTRQYVSKRARIWKWVEAKTMYPLGWLLKVGDFTTADLIKSLTQVLYQYGLPTEAIVVDNGIGRGQEFKAFLSKLGLIVPDEHTFSRLGFWQYEQRLAFSEAYTPTNKAPVERSFGLTKNEFDVFSENFVGPDKMREARHRGLQLSPEMPTETFEDYKKRFEAYLTGFYIERPRTRKTKDGIIRISIKNYFEKEMLTYTPQPVDKTRLRYAVTSEEVIKKFENNLRFKGFSFMPSEAQPFSFYNRKFKVIYNPADLTEIDLYALEAFVNEDTGEFVERGQHVVTLYNLEADPMKYTKVKKLKTEIQKRAKQAAKAVLAAQTISRDILPDKVSPNAEILKERKSVERSLASDIAAKIQSVPIHNFEIQPDETYDEHTLTIDETPDESNDDYTLTYEPEED